MASDQPIIVSLEPTLPPIDYEGLVVIDEVNEEASGSGVADEQSAGNSDDDEVQFICEMPAEKTPKKRRRNRSKRKTNETLQNGNAVPDVEIKRQKLEETTTTTIVKEVTIVEPRLSDSPDIAENEVEYLQIPSSAERIRLPRAEYNFKSMPRLDKDIWDNIQSYREKYPKKFRHFDNQIMTHYVRNVQTDVVYVWKMEIRKKILEVIREIYREADLFVVGSTINGCGSFNADMDLCCSITRNEHGGNERSFALKTLRKLRNLFFKKKYFLDMENCILINAKVPILRVNFGGNYSGLEVDLNVNNLAGVYNSYLLHYYSRIDDRFPSLCLLIKHWAKRNEIGEAMNGTLNSYSIILLVIHFLQVAVSPSILPNLQECYPNLFNENRPLNQCVLFQDLDRKYSDPSLNKQTVGELLIAFFDYYSKFDFENWAISICDARVFPREELADSTLRFKIFIEEPFDKRNTARCVTSEINFGLIKQTFIMARNCFLGKRRPDILRLGIQTSFKLKE
ncbi:hypothetical protein M3Y97_00369000 [Aphelenchoides bicaudatus]|nr:hypothetical protein M3Y97_00369000 [Aphelenchoides bicaudatus]